MFSRAGGTSVLVAGGEIFTNLERGVIDATEWIGPYHDYLMGFHKIAQNYYFPGWHETGTAFETMINSDKYNSLPTDLKAIIKYGLGMLNNWILSAFDARNAEYIRKIKEEGQVTIQSFPQEVIDHFRLNTKEVLKELSDENVGFRNVLNSYKDFQSKIAQWTDISEKEYFTKIYGQ